MFILPKYANFAGFLLNYHFEINIKNTCEYLFTHIFSANLPHLAWMNELYQKLILLLPPPPSGTTGIILYVCQCSKQTRSFCHFHLYCFYISFVFSEKSRVLLVTIFIKFILTVKNRIEIYQDCRINLKKTYFSSSYLRFNWAFKYFKYS